MSPPLPSGHRLLAARPRPRAQLKDRANIKLPPSERERERERGEREGRSGFRLWTTNWLRFSGSGTSFRMTPRWQQRAVDELYLVRVDPVSEKIKFRIKTDSGRQHGIVSGSKRQERERPGLAELRCIIGGRGRYFVGGREGVDILL